MPSRLESPMVRRENAARVLQSASFSTTNSKSIPIHVNRQDIQEEWEIREQEMIAEARDHYMFHRIVNGMIALQRSNSSNSHKSETDKSIANIMRTRYKNIDSEMSKDSALLDDYDDEADPAYSGHRRDPRATPSDENERPPDAIFMMEM